MYDLGPHIILHDQTNRGPRVNPDEALILRELIAEARKERTVMKDSVGQGAIIPAGEIVLARPATHVVIPLSLFERLVHTAERQR